MSGASSRQRSSSDAASSGRFSSSRRISAAVYSVRARTAGSSSIFASWFSRSIAGCQRCDFV